MLPMSCPKPLPIRFLKLNAYKLKTSIPHRDALRVEGFDFVNSCGCRCGGGGDFDFHERFGEVLGVGVTGFIQRLRIGIDGEEVAAGGGTGKKW